MRRIFRMYVALALVMLGAMNVSAQDRIPFDAEHFTFNDYTGWDNDAVEIGPNGGSNFLLNEASGCPIGDTNCNAWVNLSGYSKMYIKMAGCDGDGALNGSNPRIFINRTVDNGQFNADRSQAKCLVIPNAGTWAETYYTKEDDDTYVIDLAKIAKDFGFVHFHSIKGSAWNTKAIVYSIEVEKGAAVGWTSLVNNGSLEGSDVSNYFVSFDATNNEGYQPAEITDGAGVNGSRGIMVTSLDNPKESWATQFFIRLNEPLAEGTPWRISFDMKADHTAAWGGGIHKEPRNWMGGALFPATPEFTTEFYTYTAEGTISADQAGMQSIAFDLNNDTQANNYYFDNIKFEVYKYGTIVGFSQDILLVDFGFETNLAELVKKSGKTRLIFPSDCAAVKVNGTNVELYSIEAYADGRFYIFTVEPIEETDEVLVSFTNPADPNFHLLYTSESVKGQTVKDFADLEATYDSEVEADDAYPYIMATPILVAANPEDGSFNLPNSIKEFKLTFDKNVDCAALVATLNGEALDITPNTNFATEFTLTRKGTNDLATGAYTINVTKIYPEIRLADEVFGDTTYTFNVGKVELDPTDVEETVMTDDFAASGASWIVNADAGGMQDANSGAGCRLMHGRNTAFVPDLLYLCQRGTPAEQGGVALYGTKDDAKLTLKAKNYHLTLGASQWDRDDARTLRVQVLPENAVDFTNGAILDESQILAEDFKAIEPKLESGKAVRFDLLIPVKVEGNYIIRLVPGNAAGQPNGFADGCAIGDIKVQYLPNTPGAEWIRLLDAALKDAIAMRDKFAGERYEGETQTAQSTAIEKYQIEKENYTNPTAYQNAADDLKALTAALEAFANQCNKYDELIKKGVDVIRQTSAEEDNGKPNQKRKFMGTELFAQLTDVVAKYHGSSEWKDVANHEGEDPENPVEAQWQLFYEYDVLKDATALETAISELDNIVNETSKLFTVGKPSMTTTGVAALVERQRLGAEALKSLGVAEDDELVVSALNALTDDDALSERLKIRLTGIIYGQLQDPDNKLFEGVTNDQLEVITPTYDMTAFVKNPNAYALAYSSEIPGWEKITGNAKSWSSWDGNVSHNDQTPYIEDCALHPGWHAVASVEQTISDLPAGVYTIQFRANDNSATSDGTYAYVKTTETPAVEDGAEFDKDLNLAGYADVNNSGWDREITNITVTDGILTLGFAWGPESQAFFDEVHILLTGPADVDYKQRNKEHEDTGVEALEAQPANACAIELYTLDGRRISNARQGIVIVKKIMNDGTVRTEKVIRK